MIHPVKIALYTLLLTATLTPLAYSERQFTDDQWREDLAQYVAFSRKTHINLHHTVSEADFNDALSTLNLRIPELSDAGIVMEMIALAARIHDGHSWVEFGPNIPVDLLPIGFYEFSDGPYVTHGIRGHRNLESHRLVAIADTPVNDLLQRAERYCSRDNEYGVINSRVHWLANVAFLTHENLLQPGQEIPVTLESPAGERVDVQLSPVPASDFITELQTDYNEPDTDKPLYLQNGDLAYWVEYLPEHKAVYMKFNAVRDLPDGPRLGQFANKLIDTIEEHKAEKLIIDIRHNSGGDGNLTRQLIRKIKSCERINQKGRLFVITGRRTFSAALMFTARMERETNVNFVGEPGRGKPNSYSEHNDFHLNHTGVTGSISSLFHQEGEPDDTREYIDVQIPVPLTSKDYFEHRDPALEAVLAR